MYDPLLPQASHSWSGSYHQDFSALTQKCCDSHSRTHTNKIIGNSGQETRDVRATITVAEATRYALILLMVRSKHSKRTLLLCLPLRLSTGVSTNVSTTNNHLPRMLARSWIVRGVCSSCVTDTKFQPSHCNQTTTTNPRGWCAALFWFRPLVW